MSVVPVAATPRKIVEVRSAPMMRDLLSMDLMVGKSHHKTRSAAAKKEVSRDEEGNGSGFLFGLPVPE